MLWTYFFAIFLYAMLSLIAPGTYSPAQALLTSLCEPVLRPFRRLIPPLANLDLSPLWAGILIRGTADPAACACSGRRGAHAIAPQLPIQPWV